VSTPTSATVAVKVESRDQHSSFSTHYSPDQIHHLDFQVDNSGMVEFNVFICVTLYLPLHLKGIIIIIILCD